MKQVSSVSSWQVIPLVCRGGRMNAFMKPLTTPSKDILACTWFTALHLFFSLPSPESKLAPQVITRLLQQSAFIWKALPRCDLHLPLPLPRSLSLSPPSHSFLPSLTRLPPGACHEGSCLRCVSWHGAGLSLCNQGSGWVLSWEIKWKSCRRV